MIRPATRAEVKSLYGLIVLAGLDMWSRLGLDHWLGPYLSVTPHDLERFTDQRALFGFYENGTPLAVFILRGKTINSSLWRTPSAPALYPWKLAVHPSRQRSGIGRQCMAFVEAEASRQGLSAVRFDAVTSNRRLVEWYKRLGYVDRGVHRVPHSLIRPELLLEKTLLEKEL